MLDYVAWHSNKDFGSRRNLRGSILEALMMKGVLHLGLDEICFFPI